MLKVLVAKCMQYQHVTPSTDAVCQYPNIMLLCLPPDCLCVVGTGVSQQQLDQLSAQLPRVQQQRQANGQAGPEGSLKMESLWRTLFWSFDFVDAVFVAAISCTLQVSPSSSWTS
jgi:hypothetical protein